MHIQGQGNVSLGHMGVSAPLCLPVWQPNSALDPCGGEWVRVGPSSNRGRSVLCFGPGREPQVSSCLPALPAFASLLPEVVPGFRKESLLFIPRGRWGSFTAPLVPGCAAAGFPSSGRDIASNERRVQRCLQSFLPVSSQSLVASHTS